MQIVRLVALLASIWCAAALGCGDNDGEIPAECEEIAEICHDSTSDMGQSCHENAEDAWSAQECQENEAACLAECTGD